MARRCRPALLLRFALAGLALGAAAITTAAPRLVLPIACQPGVSCWVANYVDQDPGPRVQDWNGGTVAYDGHGGTDFALPHRRALEAGVAVLAAADGTVLRTRDGVGQSRTPADRARAEEDGRECGNGVVVDHGDGWQTQYCHLAAASLRVASGDRVEAGTPLGEVGLSGATEFPHLHFVLRHHGEVIDPFGGTAAASLWDPPLARRLGYTRGAIYNLGLAAGAPNERLVRAGENMPVTPDAPALVAWAEAFAVRPGDVLRLEIRAPDGAVWFATEHVVDRPLARVFRYAGRRRGETPLRAGTYEVHARALAPDGTELSSVRMLRRIGARTAGGPAGAAGDEG